MFRFTLSYARYALSALSALSAFAPAGRFLN